MTVTPTLTDDEVRTLFGALRVLKYGAHAFGNPSQLDATLARIEAAESALRTGRGERWAAPGIHRLLAEPSDSGHDPRGDGWCYVHHGWDCFANGRDVGE